MRTGTMASLAAAAALAVAGCGGSSSSGLGKQQLDAKVNAMCARYNARLANLTAPSDLTTNADSAAAYLDRVEALATPDVAAMKALKPASSIKAQYDAYVADVSHQLSLLRSADAKAHAHDQSGLAVLQSIADYGKGTVDPASRRLGFAECAREVTPKAPAGGTISVVYDQPSNSANAEAETVLKNGGTDALAKDFTDAFILPSNITIHAVNQFVGPNWDPSTSTITLSYQFVQYIANVLRQSFPELRGNDFEFGKEIAAVDAFVATHELGHALIHVFGLPVLGKEEDAADSLAAVFLTRFVPKGDEYSFDAAKFFHGMSARQRKLAPSDYWDVHSLDQQRSYEIVCWVAGSNQQDYQRVAQLGILGAARLQTCPAEYQQKLQSWTELLRPHFRPGS
jgi:hypothetical protein